MERDKFEIIVVKNFSDPEIDTFMENNGIISIVTKEQTLGSKVALALEASRGEIISFLEDDDSFDDNKLSIVSKYFEQDQELCYLHNSFETIDDSGKKVNRVPYFMRTPTLGQALDIESKVKDSMASVYSFGLHFNLSSITIRRSVAKLEHLRDENIVDVLLFYMAVTMSGRILYLPECLTLYRVHQSDSKSLGVGFGKFLEAKVRFHEKLYSSLSKAALLVKGSPVEEYVLGDLGEQRLIIDILSRQTDRRRLLGHIVSCLRYSTILSDHKKLYMLQLSLMGLLRMLPFRGASFMAYCYSALS